MSECIEVNFDGLVGPTHHYAGLGIGNLASQKHTHLESNPQAAFLQGLEKMHALMQLGIPQAFFPPHLRPNMTWLRQLGFSGTQKTIINKVSQLAPELLSIAYSSAFMWTANAATISPAADTQDGRVHITPANLVSQAHRQQDAWHTARLLKKIFHDEQFFCHHSPLPMSMQLGDEGAANHTRLCVDYGKPGVHVFVYGADGDRFRARQTRLAQEAIAYAHQLSPDKVIFAEQSAEAIDNGVFHNDVIAVGNKTLYFCHEQAYTHQQAVCNAITEKSNFDVQCIQVKASELSLIDAVSSYLFNSQIVSTPSGQTILIAPTECEHNPRVAHYLKSHAYFDNIIYQDCRQSMQNGGGPACLRLRVVLSPQALASIPESCILTQARYEALKAWAKKHYRTQLTIKDLADPNLATEVTTALNALEKLK